MMASTAKEASAFKPAGGGTGFANLPIFPSWRINSRVGATIFPCSLREFDDQIIDLEGSILRPPKKFPLFSRLTGK
jgi:hypothetical protein